MLATALSACLIAVIALLQAVESSNNPGFLQTSYLNKQQSALLHDAYRPIIRNATLDDVSAITDILVDAWAPSVTDKYIYQFRDQYPIYHWKCIEQVVRHGLEHSSKDVIVNVIHASSKVSGAGNSNTNDASGSRAVSFAVWDLRPQKGRGTSKSDMSTLPFLASDVLDVPLMSMINCADQRDLNITRAAHLLKEGSAYKAHYINDVYESQIYLRLLGTHPDFDGLGFAAAQCEWGKTLAKQKGLNITLIATPPGYEVYRTVGFDEIANVTFTTVEGDFLSWDEVMVYDPSKGSV